MASIVLMPPMPLELLNQKTIGWPSKVSQYHQKWLEAIQRVRVSIGDLWLCAALLQCFRDIANSLLFTWQQFTLNTEQYLGSDMTVKNSSWVTFDTCLCAIYSILDFSRFSVIDITEDTIRFYHDSWHKKQVSEVIWRRPHRVCGGNLDLPIPSNTVFVGPLVKLLKTCIFARKIFHKIFKYFKNFFGYFKLLHIALILRKNKANCQQLFMLMAMTHSRFQSTGTSQTFQTVTDVQ